MAPFDCSTMALQIESDGDGNLVPQLDAIAEAVVEVEVGDPIGTGGGVAFADPAEVDLPMLIAGSFRVVGAEWRTALGVGRGGEEDEQSQSSKPNQAEALETPTSYSCWAPGSEASKEFVLRVVSPEP